MHSEFIAAANASDLYPYTLDVLSRLHEAGVPMGLIRNTTIPTAHMREVLDSKKCLPFFTTMILSGEAGVSKPSPELFALASQRAGPTAVDDPRCAWHAAR